MRTDYERKVIRLLDAETGQWREYPYPVTDRSLNVWMLPNGLISVKVYTEDRYDPLPGELFFLNPDTGLYTEPPTVCEGKVIQAEEGKGKWTVAYRGEWETKPFLCHSETGEKREALPSQPEGTEWRVYENESLTYLLFIGKNHNFEDSGRLLLRVYSYRLADEQIMLLGGIDGGVGDFASLCGWVSDTQGLVCASFSFGQMGASRFAFDLTQGNSLLSSSYGWREETIRLENPTRYISADSDRYSGARMGIEAGDAPCTVSIYDAKGIREHEVDDSCVPILIDSNMIAPFYRQGDSLYFLAQTDLYPNLSTLTRYDMQQETMTRIGPYAAEIENIISVSPDERYIVLLTDDNHALDFPWDTYLSGCCQQQYGWYVTIIDAQADDIVYLSERLGVYNTQYVKWLDKETVVIASDEIYKEDAGFLYAPPATLRTIRLGETIKTESVTIGVDVASPNQYGLYNQNTVIDLFTFEPVSIFQEGVLEMYSVYMGWDDETGDLVVYVYLPDDSHSTEYRVTLPNSARSEEMSQ